MKAVRALHPRPALALCALAAFLTSGAAGTVAMAGIDTKVQAAWAEATALSGVEPTRLTRPEVLFEPDATSAPLRLIAEYVPFAHEVRIYRPGEVPLHTLLVHEFLHSIYYEIHSASLTLSQLEQEDPSEAWVRGLMEHTR